MQSLCNRHPSRCRPQCPSSGSVFSPWRLARLLALLALLAVVPAQAIADDKTTDEEAAAIEARLAETVKFLAADEMEGRGVGTKGLDMAADYVAEQFNEIGLKTDPYDGKPFQAFSLAASIELGTDNTMTFVGPADEDGEEPQRIELEMTNDFTPFSVSGTTEFDLPLVFAGYGITAELGDEKFKYDDYEGIDVKGKMVVIFRHEPQQKNGESVFDGTKNTEHAPFERKIANAIEHGAAGILFVTDQIEILRNTQRYVSRWQRELDQLAAEHEKFKEVKNPTLEQIEEQRKEIEKRMQRIQTLGEALAGQYDPVLSFRAARQGEKRDDFPVLHCRREVLDQVVRAALDTSLAELEKQIDEGPAARSKELTGWKAVGKTDIRREEQIVKNVVAVLEGEGPTADETIIIGAHYDHVGFGRSRTKPPEEREVYNGADDNASGTAGIIEIARTLAAREEKLKRRIVFVAFTAEERGLLGSSYHANHPLFPMEETVAMINLDMIGRLEGDKLTIHGTGSAKEFDQLLDRIGEDYGFELSKRPGSPGNSDHAPFYRKQVPVLFPFSGIHKDYHRPTDDFERINVEGMRRITQFATDIVIELANAPERPAFVEVTKTASPKTSGSRPFFGSIPDFSEAQKGYALSGVTKDGPAEKAGMKAGDVVIQLGEDKIGNLEEFDAALRKHKPGEKVKTIIRRDGKEMTVEVTLAPPK